MGDTDGNGDVNIIDLLIVIELGPLLVIPHHNHSTSVFTGVLLMARSF